MSQTKARHYLYQCCLKRIAKPASGIATIKESYCNFEADVSPQENYENLLEDEYQQSFFHFYYTYIKELSDQDLNELNKLRSVNIEKIFYFGDNLKQSSQTIYLACAYFELLLFRQFLQDKQRLAIVGKFEASARSKLHSIERHHSATQPNKNNEEFDMLLQTPVNEKVRDKHMNLKAQMCLLLASKFDELDDYIPMIRDFQKLARYEFSYRECKDEEEAVLRQLGWSLGFITPYHILDSLISQGVIFEDDKIRGSENSENRSNSFTEEKLRSVRKQSEYFYRLAISSNFDMQVYKPSLIAVSCILSARLSCHVLPWWNDKLIELTSMNIYDCKELRECFDKLYMLHDETYVPNKLCISKNQQNFKSMISTCDANTLENTQINGIQFKKSNVLEQNQNITNDSFINSTSNKNLRDQDTQPRYAQNQFNYEINLGDDSNISKRHIDQVPESHIANRHSQLNQNQSKNNFSNRSSVSLLNTNKLRYSENNMTEGSLTNKSQITQKKHSVNKENQQIGVTSGIRVIQTVQLEQKQGRLTQNPSSQQLENYQLKATPTLEQSKHFNQSQIFKLPATRCSTNISHVNLAMNISNAKTHVKQQSSINEVKQRNSSQSSLIVNKKQSSQKEMPQHAIQQKSIMLKLGQISNKMASQQSKKSSGDQQEFKGLNQIRYGGIQVYNKGSNSRKLSSCSNTSTTKIENIGSLNRKGINNQKLGIYTNEYMTCKNVQVKQAKSSRNSTSNVLTDNQTKDIKVLVDPKIEELRLKYQTENPIFEKGMLAVAAGRNQTQSMLSGFHAHSKTYAILHPSNILNKSTSRERSSSECDIYQKNPYGNIRASLQLRKSSEINQCSNPAPPKQTEDYQQQVKNTIVFEDDHEGDKSAMELSLTQAFADEMNPGDEDTVVIKRPMSSRKSKSIENVNKFTSHRKLSNSNHAIIDIYKKQYQQYDKSENTRNILSSQQQTRIATIDLQHIQRPSSNIKTNYIKKNINYVTTLTCQLQQSIDTNSSHVEGMNNKEIMMSHRDNFVVQQKRTSRCSNQVFPQSTQNYNSKDMKNKLSTQFIKSSLSKRRASENKLIQNQTLNQSHNFNNSQLQNHNATSSIIRKSTQQNAIKLLLNHKSSANIIESRLSQEPKRRIVENTKDVKERKFDKITIDQMDTTQSINKFQNIKSGNLSACSSQVHLKERPYQKFLNNENKQFFTAFSKNFKNNVQKKSPTPTQNLQQNLDTIRIKVISPDQQLIEQNDRSQSLLQALRSQQLSNQIKSVSKQKTSRQPSNKSTSCDVVHPPLSQRSNVSSQKNDSSIFQNTQSIIKFHKFQARKPMKQNHSLIERALLKKSQLSNLLKPFESNQAANTLDNTCESTYEERQSCSNNGTFYAIQKNMSINNSSLTIPILSQTQTSAKNVRISHAKSPSQLIVSNVVYQQYPQDIPPPISGRPSGVVSSNISINQSINAQTRPSLLAASNTTHNLHPQKIQKNVDLRQQKPSKNHQLPYIQPPISARVSNKYKDLSQNSEMIIKEEDEFKMLTQQFKKQMSKKANATISN
eukprot:403364240